MEFLLNPSFWAKFGGIVLADLLLAGDNALVIAMAIRSLPPKQQFWGRVWGSLGAVALRVLFIFVISWLLNHVPLLQFVGGIALIWIAVKLVRPSDEGVTEQRAGGTLRQAIGLIIVADLIMSLDNVIAIAGIAKNDFVLVVFGLLLSLPLVVWGSGFIATLMNRHKWIIWLGGGVLGYVAVRMIVEDPVIHKWIDRSIHYGAPLTMAVIITLLGWRFAREADRSKESENAG